MRNTHAEYDKVATILHSRDYHTQSGVQLLLSLTRIQSLRSFDSQIKRSETPIHIYVNLASLQQRMQPTAAKLVIYFDTSKPTPFLI